MKKLSLLLITLFSLSFASAQLASSTIEGNYDFIPGNSLIGITFDFSTTDMNGFEGMDAYVESTKAELELMENEKAARKWSEGWTETYINASNEFVIILNDEIGKKSGLKFEKDAKTEVYGIFVVKSMENGKGMGSYCEISGVLTFYDANDNVLAVEDYKKVRGNMSGQMGIYTMGDGYKVGTCFKKAAVPLGKKLYNQYFNKKKK